MTTKVDSLVKFLEEERSVRKAAEAETYKRDKRIIELDCDLQSFKQKFDLTVEEQKGLKESLLRFKEENARLKREKVETIEEK